MLPRAVTLGEREALDAPKTVASEIESVIGRRVRV
jgi:hypothetical protein